jgi:hypothetical protein
MSAHPHPHAKPLDLSRWRKLPNLLIGVGGLLALVGALVSYRHDDLHEFGYAWLVAFMFSFALVVGALFLVLVHHLFDAGWSVPIRRTCENIASLMPWMAVLFLPIALLAPRLYGWMQNDPATDHALHAKMPLFTRPGFYIASALIFGLLSFIALGLRKWSLAQDRTGAAECTHQMRKYSYFGIFLFAFLVTLGAILWMKALQHQWFSTMYGVYYFAGSVWTTLATVYVITMALSRLNVLRVVLHKHQFYYLGSLFFAFTVFYAYVTFAQYFIIWNANMPEETFWFVQRENGTWFWVSMVIIFGHFFLPFLALLRIDAKENFMVMTFFCGWAWLMRFTDMTFNILPVAHPEGLPFAWLWLSLGCTAFMVGVLIKLYLGRYASAAPYPLKDPRLVEAMGLYHPVATPISGGEVGDLDSFEDVSESEGGKS